MFLRPIIESSFKSYIEEKFKGKHDVISFLSGHERKEKFFDNLIKEMKKSKFDELLIRTGNENARKKVVYMSKEMTKMFCLAALNVKEKSIRNFQVVTDDSTNDY